MSAQYMPNPLALFANYFVFIISIFSFLSPFVFYYWYRKRGGRDARMILPALIPCVLAGFSFVDEVLLIAAFVYVFFAPLISYILYIKCGGKKRWILWFVLLPFFSLLFKGLLSLVLA